MKVEIHHRQLSRDESINVYLKVCRDMYDHLVDMHGIDPRDACVAVLNDFAKMIRR